MTEHLEDYLGRMDAAQTGAGMAFNTQDAKDRHESLLTYARRKYAAATYHLGNVRRLLRADADRMDKDVEDSAFLADKTTVESSSSFTRPADEYVYELSAFLEALKSAIDLLSEASGAYLRGVEVNYSIGPLLKLVQKGARSPILDAVRDNSGWLSTLRDYRHHLVHRLMPSVRAGHAIRSVGKITSSALIPVVVPDRTPQYEPDTRRTLAEQMVGEPLEGLPGISVQTEKGTIKTGKSREETVHLAIEIGPVPGYGRIEEFMKEQLKLFSRFADQMIHAFLSSKFVLAAIDRQQTATTFSEANPT